MKVQKKAEDVAVARFKLITPLLDEQLDKGRFYDIKRDISEKSGVSYRTLSRYYAAYQEKGFEGLKPSRTYKRKDDKLPENYEELVELAIELRKESASRSVADIIRILELEGRVTPGVLSRSTLQRHMQAAGFSARHVRLYAKKGAAARRFQKAHRCQLWQSDIKYGPTLPIGKDGSKKQIYLVVWIDDCTRQIMEAKFYDNQRVEVIEDSLRNAIMKRGKPASIFVDNGKQYRSEWLRKACAKLEIRLLTAKPYSPEAKGKVESFNRRIDSFISEAVLSGATTLHEYNDLLDLWIREYYSKHPHSGLGGISPDTAFRTDTAPLRFVDSAKLREAFLHTVIRVVDKVGCISEGGSKYEVGLSLMGRKVEVYFDPSWTDEVEIHYEGMKPFMAKRLVIGENCGKRRELPEEIKAYPVPKSSRMLDGLLKQQRRSMSEQQIATVFRELWEDKTHV